MKMELLQMIKEHASDIALQMGIKLSQVSIVDGHTLGCRDASLLNMTSKGHVVSALVFQSDRVGCDRLEIRIRSALLRLQMLLEP